MSRPAALDPEGFVGRAVVITGGGSGIGRAAAQAFGELGASVMVVGRRADAVEKTAAGQDGIRWVAADVTDPADVERMVRETTDAFGRIDVVVNNAGLMAPTPLGGVDVEVAREVWATNVLGPTLLSQAALPELSRVQGSIVNVSSSFAHRPAPGASHYGASKAAVESLTRSWALELADRGVRVNAVVPGPTESEALERSARPTCTKGCSETVTARTSSWGEAVSCGAATSASASGGPPGTAFQNPREPAGTSRRSCPASLSTRDGTAIARGWPTVGSPRSAALPGSVGRRGG